MNQKNINLKKLKHIITQKKKKEDNIKVKKIKQILQKANNI